MMKPVLLDWISVNGFVSCFLETMSYQHQALVLVFFMCLGGGGGSWRCVGSFITCLGLWMESDAWCLIDWENNSPLVP